LRPAPFIGMVTTFIIAIYSKDSPLRIRMAGNGGYIGQGWTSKHGMVAVIGTSDRCSLVPRCKRTHWFHLGSNGSFLGEGTKGCVFGPFGGHWGTLRNYEVKEKHKVFITKLKDQPYSPYEALITLFGQTRASEIAATGQCSAPSSCPNLNTKRVHTDQQSIDADEKPLSPSAKRSHR